MSELSANRGDTTEFPILLLHSELVRYFAESDEQRNAEGAEWLARIDKSTTGELSDDEKRVARQLFAQGSAETRLEELGYRVGYALAERLSKDLGRIPTQLEHVKFICKDFWINVFGKQVDNLRTNHEGIYVIQDNCHMLLTPFADGTQYLDKIGLFFALPSGIVRGALSNLGIEARVTATVERLPLIRFNITVLPPQAVEET